MNWYSAYEKPIASASDVVIAFDLWSACATCGTWVKYEGPCACVRVVKDAHAQVLLLRRSGADDQQCMRIVPRAVPRSDSVKYPDECPVFEVDGMHFEARPYVYVVVSDVDDWIADRELALVDCDGEDLGWLVPTRADPLTAAARRLLRWTRL